MSAQAPAPPAGGDGSCYLPGFCETRAVLAVVLIAGTYRVRLRFPLVLGEAGGPP